MFWENVTDVPYVEGRFSDKLIIEDADGKYYIGYYDSKIDAFKDLSNSELIISPKYWLRLPEIQFNKDVRKITIDEAIENAQKTARKQRYYANFERGMIYQSCIRCTEKYEQLVEWLEELKLLRDKNGCDICESDQWNAIFNSEKAAYKKAISDFEAWLANEIKAIDSNNHKLLVAKDGVWEDAFEIFKKLK